MPFTDSTFSGRELARVKQQTQVQRPPLWPKATAADNPNGLNWDLLIDLANRKGEARLDFAQFVRVNKDPGERHMCCR